MKILKKMSKKAKNNLPKIKKLIVICWLLVIFLVLSVVVYFSLTANGKLGDMPSFEELENTNENLATKIWSEDKVLLGTFFRENRSEVSFDELSPKLVDALICTEDVRYYEHSGIDFQSLPRVITGIIGSGSKGGGSTITQQLAKMLFPRKQNMSKIALVHRKFQEWIIATKLERNYTKEEILTMYLNKFDFLNLAVGIESASRVYFNTTPDKLKTEEAAMLVGMAKNPSLYNPLRRIEETKNRRNVVMYQMMKYGKLSKEEYDSLKNLPISLNYKPVDHNIGIATYFREFIRLWLTAKEPKRENYIDQRDFVEDSINWQNDPSFGWISKNKKATGENYDIYKDGLEIYTTIDSRMQEYAEYAVTEHLSNEIQPAFFRDQKNNKHPPFGNDVAPSQIEKIMRASMRRSDRWITMRNEGISESKIEKSFYEPQEMTIFSWNDDTTIFKTIFKDNKHVKNVKINRLGGIKKIVKNKKTKKNDTIYNRYSFDVTMTPYDSLIYYKHFLRTGFMSMEPESGHVKAYVGGIDFQNFKFDQVSKSRRQIGSTIKPFIYSLAMQNGYSPCTKVPNVEVTFKINNGDKEEFYTPKFSSTKLDGEMITLKQGLANSLNQISAWVLKQCAAGINNNYDGVENVVKIANSMGINSPIEPVPSICTGAAEVLISELVSSYCAFANQAKGIKPLYITKIVDKNGNTLANFVPRFLTTEISPSCAYLTLELMKGVINEGTGISLRYKYDLKGEIAGKTGTTNSNSDGWFVGLTPQLVSACWVGGEERSIRFNTMLYGQGAALALPIWGIYMKKVFDDPKLPYSTTAVFKRPSELDVDIDCSKYDNEENEENFNH